MANAGKCPKCEKTVAAVRVEDVDMLVGNEPRWKGVTYACGHCNAILNVGIDPIALKTEIVAEIVSKLRGH